jgi:hypothetical protein
MRLDFAANCGHREDQPTTSGERTLALEPPGFMLRNYGRQTPLATIASHIAYGAIVGGFMALAG